MNFTPIDNRGTVEAFCIVKSCDKKVSSKGDTYLDILLSDKSGEINAKLWSYSPAEHGEYGADDLVKVRGTLSKYQGNDQLRIDRIRPVLPSDNVQLEDFVKSAEYSGTAMFDELLHIAEGFEDNTIKQLTVTLLTRNREALLFWPAAYKLHHAIRGGLLLHTLSIVRLCDGVCKIYPNVDRELLMAGAMLHDIAKTVEFEVSAAGTATGYSVKGNLIGHLAEGAMMIRDTAKELGLDGETAMLLEHMVLSHHGDPEFGACMRPMFLEAILLSQLDMLDATVYEVNDAVGNLEKGEFSGRMWALDNRKLYNHSRKAGEETLKLF
ncbi:MAG: HD domain-containing protein [Clostridia bacterium]|nr:HD domain-containing protein [Clostridia bacterium]